MSAVPTPADIRYVFNSKFARMVRWLCRKGGKNWCVTVGTTCYVSEDFIKARSRAHEFCHTLQWHRMGRPSFVLRYYTRLIRGYAKHPMEIEATRYADTHTHLFIDLPSTDAPAFEDDEVAVGI